MSPKDAFNVGTATREIILSQSLSKGDPNNRHVRQSLGFRELKDGRGKPVFASKAVTSLHNTLDKFALMLPYHDLDELRSEWKKGEHLQDELEQLLTQYGPQIWGIPVIERHSKEQPLNPLQRAGDNHFYPIDLMWGMSTHKRYIKLQLEHLVYIKAIRYRINHGTPSKPHSGAANRTRVQDGDTDTHRDTTADTGLQATLMLGTKHHVDDDDEWTPCNNHKKRKNAGHGRENVSERRSGRASKVKKSYANFYPEQVVSPTIPAPSIGQNDQNETEEVHATLGLANVQIAQAAIDLAEGTTAENSNLSNPTAEESHSHDDGSPLTEVPENLSDRAPSSELGLQRLLPDPVIQQVEDPSTVQALSDQGIQGGGQPANAGVDEPTTGNQEQVQDLNHETQQGSLHKDKTSQEEETKIISRIKLRELLRKDLGSAPLRLLNPTEEDIYEMWGNTEDLNNAIKAMWKIEQDSLQQKMGPQLYECRKFVLDMWTSWRQFARVIGIATNCHPARDKMPEYSYKEWVQKLGSDDAVDDMEDELLTCYECLQTFKGKDEREALDKVAEHLTTILSELTGQPAGRWTRLVTRFNDKLFKWGPSLEFLP